MSLETGGVAADQSVPGVDGSVGADHLASLRPIRLVLAREGNVGAALKAARESLGLAEDDIEQVTRVRATYIAAIESFDFDLLPARPFVVGYVKAYAQALGLDPGVVVARFKAEAPKVDGKLRAPGGVRHDAFASIRWLMVVGAVVASAVVVWNLTRRVELRVAAPDESPVRVAVSPRPPGGPAQIGAPLPTPPEATTPPVYQTPGLGAPVAPQPAAGGDTAAVASAESTSGAPFAPAGTIYGATDGGSGVLLQARKSATLVVHGPGGEIYFARLLAPGEAWRAPAISGLTVDVADPVAMELFVGGASRGRLTQTRTSLAHLDQP
jgi:cytoskeleton protein RodZ